jgi:1,4-dihydroxy-2-naphthoate octaprenyltransferase
VKSDILSDNKPLKSVRSFLTLGESRYWTASLLPALVGTTLPFWLHPPEFSFRLFAAIEFLIATVLVHAGFSLLLAYFEGNQDSEWQKSKLLKYASGFIITACLLGLHINSGLTFHYGVPKSIFIVYGIVMFIVGVLYVVPPINLGRRMGREIVIAEGLGMIPVLGAYLVQVGDITRTVYLASLPLVVATGLWVWLEELAGKTDDEKAGRGSLVIDFGLKFSGRFGVLALSALFYATIIAAVFSGSTSLLTLTLFLLAGLVWKILSTSWSEYLDPERMCSLSKRAYLLHFATGFIVTISSLFPHLSIGYFS